MASKANDGSQGMCSILDFWNLGGLPWIALHIWLMMMMDLFVMKNVLDLQIDKYLLIYPFTGNFFGYLLVFSIFGLLPVQPLCCQIFVRLLDFHELISS